MRVKFWGYKSWLFSTVPLVPKDQNTEWCASAQWRPSVVLPAAIFNRWIFLFSMNESTKTATRLLFKMHVDRLRSWCSAMEMCFLKSMFKYMCIHSYFLDKLFFDNGDMTFTAKSLTRYITWVWIPSSCWQPISTMLRGCLMFSLGSSLFPSQYT